MQKLAFLLAAMLYLGSLAAQDSSAVQQLRQFVSSLAKKDSFSGVVLLAKKNRILYQGAFGEASKEYGVPINLQTRFDLASITKSFTGIAIAQLAAQGKLKFTDQVSKHLPELPANLTKGITIEHLLTHTSGLGSFWTSAYHESNHARFRNLKDYVSLIEKDTLLFTPGARWSYSNAGYLLLGLVIEKLSGKTYFDFVRQNILLKAGMTSSDFLERDQPNKNVANGYTRQNRYSRQESYSTTYFLGPVKGSSAGGLYSTAGDLLKFSNAILEHRLLNEELTNTVLQGKTPYDRPERRKKYAYGFAEQFVNNVRIVFHDGGANGISTQLDIYPETGYTVIVLSNYDPPAGTMIANYMRTVLTR